MTSTSTEAVAEFCRGYGPLTAQGQDPCFYLPTRKWPEAYDSYVELAERTAIDRGRNVLPISVVALHYPSLSAVLTKHTGMHHKICPARELLGKPKPES